MKSKYTTYAVAVLIGCGICTVKADEALSATCQKQIKTELTGVSLAEAMNNSVKLVSSAPAADRTAVIEAVMKTMAHTHVTALPSVAGAIARSNPAMADVVAGEAARLHPEEAVSIVRATVQVAPDQAGSVVESVLFYAPSAFREVGEVAINASPSQSRAVVQAISANALDLKPYFDNLLAGNGLANPTAAVNAIRHATLISHGAAKHLTTDLMGAQVVQNTSAYGYVNSQSSLKPLNVGSAPQSISTVSGLGSPTFMPAPVFSMPITVRPASPVEISPGSSDPVPPGGLNYSTP